MGAQTSQTNLAIQPAGSTTLNVTAALGAPASSALKIVQSKTLATGASGTIHTVTAGKTAHIIGYMLAVQPTTSAGATQEAATIAANGVTLTSLFSVKGATASTNTTPAVHQVILPVGYSIDVAATQTITLSIGANSWGTGTVIFYED